jgi:pimeloyl-ACP methyl ester carboxylesterase
MAVSRRRNIIRLVLGSFWLCFMSWQFASMQAWGVREDVLQSSASVTVAQSDESIGFFPSPDTQQAALAFLPGALVDPDAYTPMARRLAERGYAVVIVKVPMRLALLESQEEEVRTRLKELLERDDRQHRWILGGHSRGGAMAADFAGDDPAPWSGLLLVGTSHPRERDLSELPLPVTKVFGSEDGLASEAEVRQFSGNLPSGTQWVRIAGGNHAQFGWYGRQLGDDKATISRSEQQRRLVEAVEQMLARIARSGP